MNTTHKRFPRSIAEAFPRSYGSAVEYYVSSAPRHVIARLIARVWRALTGR